jgi:hypothetical protein
MILYGLFDPLDSIIYLLFSITNVLRREASCLPFSNVRSVVAKFLLTLHQLTIMIHMFPCIIHKHTLVNHLHILLILVVMF